MTPDGSRVVFHTDATNLLDVFPTAHQQILMKGFPAYTFFYFAEGCTGDGFQEWLCLGSPLPDDIIVECTYLFSDAPRYAVPAGSRATFKVNEVLGDGYQPSSRVEVTSGSWIIVERPMYFDYGGWNGGHDVVGYGL